MGCAVCVGVVTGMREASKFSVNDTSGTCGFPGTSTVDRQSPVSSANALCHEQPMRVRQW
eukprot:scaffold1156_cov394-Prasinococcus_capsulatus_cf.AAC.10